MKRGKAVFTKDEERAVRPGTAGVRARLRNNDYDNLSRSHSGIHRVNVNIRNARTASFMLLAASFHAELARLHKAHVSVPASRAGAAQKLC